jgi:hypothetical protein
MIVSNSVKCHKCGDVIYSAHRHDFKWCSCGNIAVDGGTDYLRRAGAGLADGSYMDLSIDLPEDVVNGCIDAWDRHKSLIMLAGTLFGFGYNVIKSAELMDSMDAAVKWGQDTGRNSRGIVYAIFRAMRDNGVEFSESVA